METEHGDLQHTHHELSSGRGQKDLCYRIKQRSPRFFLALNNSAFLVTAGKVGHMEDPGRTLNLIRFIFIVHVCAAFGELVESILTPYFHKYNSPRMAKITMKKSRRRRMSINGGRDWKICRRFLKKEGKNEEKKKKTWINQNSYIFSSRWEGEKKKECFSSTYC